MRVWQHQVLLAQTEARTDGTHEFFEIQDQSDIDVVQNTIYTK
jgi:hypothetical protein